MKMIAIEPVQLLGALNCKSKFLILFRPIALSNINNYNSKKEG